MLHRSLAVAGDLKYFQPHKPKKIIERAAEYTHGSTLGWMHFHAEANYRKQPAGWKAYSKANMDIFGQTASPWPMRHFETKLPGIWFAAGHHNPKLWGWGQWFVFRKWVLLTGSGVAAPLLTLYKRMRDNGFEIKNRGAVFGIE